MHIAAGPSERTFVKGCRRWRLGEK